MTVAADYWQKERISKNGSGAKRIQKVAHTEGEKKKKRYRMQESLRSTGEELENLKYV